MLLADMVTHTVDTTFQGCEIALNRIRRDAHFVFITYVFLYAVVDLIAAVRV